MVSGSIISSEQAHALGSLGGRPKGAKNKLTIAKEKARLEMEMYTAKIARSLASSQAKIALGSYKVCVQVSIGGQKIMKQVTDEKKIDKLFATGEMGKDYFIIEASAGSWQAGNALLDRTFGKAKEHLQVDADVKFSLVELARQADERERLNIEAKDVDI